MNAHRLLLLAIGLAPALAAAQHDTGLRDAGSLGAIRLAETGDPGASKVYIVQLGSPPAVELHSQAPGSSQLASKPGLPQAPRGRFDKTDAAVQAYVDKLSAEQDGVLAGAGPGAALVYRYHYGFNGFAARMHPSLAHKIENMPGVLNVWEDEIRPLATNHSLRFLGLFDSDAGLRNPLGLDGDGIVIGVIDSGIRPEHPALQETAEADRPKLCQGDWAENSLLGKWLCHRFKRREDVLVFEPAENWNGTCQSGEQFDAELCNNKLIGARYFIDGAQNSGPIDEGEIVSARDVDGHGTHTATTAAGNRVKASVFGNLIGRIEGVAPRARIAAYKACWLRPGDQRATCNASDLANAVDAAVGDGVDVINYSVGSSLTRVTAPDDLALMNAAKAGIFAVVAAGNEGPGLGTIGSPAGGPWVLTTAASTRDGKASFEALEITSPPSVANLYEMKQANFTPTLADRGPIDGDLVLVDDDDESLDGGATGTTSDACQPLVNNADISGEVALIQRGGCKFEVKIANAGDAGAIAAVIYNIAGDAIVMNGSEDLVDIPAVMIGQADGNLLLAELDAGSAVVVHIEDGQLVTRRDDGNSMAAFSARGPGPAPDILKPDVTAPGVNILAGFTPDATNATPGEDFAYLSGTSMSTPHVAGIAALLKQASPDWSPSAIKSAFMTTARQDLTASDGESAAHPFDYGAGHIVPNSAIDPGLVYDVSDDAYDAFACGTASPIVAAERCQQLEDAGFSFAGADLNQPSIAVARLASERTVSRQVTNVGDMAETYVAEVVAPTGIGVTVTPQSISVGPGETASFDVTLRVESGLLDRWRFGSLTWVGDRHRVYSSIAVRPISVTAPAELTVSGGSGANESGTLSFPVEFGYTGSYSPGVHGLRLPLVIDGHVDNDPTKTFTFRNGDGVTIHLIDVESAQAYLRFALFDALVDGDDSIEDLDLYVYFCPDQVNCHKIGESGEPNSNEEFNRLLPDGGRYAVLVHGFRTDEVNGGQGANYQLLAWSFGLDDDPGNMTASGPAFVTAGSTETVTVNWSGLSSNTIYLGGVSHNTPNGIAAISVIRIGN